MSEPCQRFERELLEQLTPEGELSGEAAQHLATCQECQELRRRYQRVFSALRAQGSGAARRGDHVARVLAAAQPRPQPARRWAVAGAALALAAALTLWWRLRPTEPGEPVAPEFAVEVIAQAGPTLRGDAQLGDRLRVSLRAGAAVWIYRNDRELLLVCPRDCKRQGNGVVGEVAIDQVGRYQVVWLTPAPRLAASGRLEEDVAAARGAGARHELREIEVQ